MTLDLAPSTRALAELVRSVTDADLVRPTPCPAYTVADLVDHIGGLTVAFTAAATKTPLEGAGDPSGDGTRLEPGFRDRIADDLAALATAWADPAAYDGTAVAGPVELPAEVAAMVALNEVVVHGSGGYVVIYTAGWASLTVLAESEVNVGRLHLESRPVARAIADHLTVLSNGPRHKQSTKVE